MISISENKSEYLDALTRHIDTTAKILGLKPVDHYATDDYRFLHQFFVDDGCVCIKIDQKLKAEDNLFHKIIPCFNQTGFERFNINPSDWDQITKDSKPYLLRATKKIPFTSHSKWDSKGHAIRLIKADRIPKGITQIIITDDEIEFLAEASKIDIEQPIDVLLTRFAFMHNTIHDVDIFNFNEILGQAKDNII